MKRDGLRLLPNMGECVSMKKNTIILMTMFALSLALVLSRGSVTAQSGEYRIGIIDTQTALDNYENTTEFQAARELSVTVMRERDLLSYLGR